MQAFACAQAGHHDGVGGGGDDSGTSTDLGATTFPDLFGLDLTGVDLTGFPPMGDLAHGPCDVLTQTNCGANEKCSLTPTPTCISNGTQATGSICGTNMGADDCTKGNLCTTESATLSSCRQFCAADPDCKQPAAPGGAQNIAHCFYTITGTMAKVCTVACNPVLAAGNSGCGTGLGCEVFRTATIDQATDCAVMGAGGDGADCSAHGTPDCMPGFTCVSVGPPDGGTMNHCRKACRNGMAGTDCTGLAGYACVLPTGTNVLFGFCCPAGGNC